MANNLFETGIRPDIDNHLIELSKQLRDYGDYWSASSAGYCMRKIIFERLRVPVTQDDPRKQRVFTVGHIFHSWIQEITKATGKSLEQELELIDDRLMVKGHCDDIIETDGGLILYDYKTQSSRAFNYKRPNMSHYHRMQLGTYMFMLNANTDYKVQNARILKISKDDLRMTEEELQYDQELDKDVTEFWEKLNDYWNNKVMPPCTCGDYEGGFMAKERFNPFYYNGQPCSLDWYNKCKEKKNGQ